MNNAQKFVMFGVIAAMIIAFLFPPHAIFREGGGAIRMGYSFITDLPEVHSVHVTMLLAEWLGIGVIGSIIYFISKDKQQ